MRNVEPQGPRRSLLDFLARSQTRAGHAAGSLATEPCSAFPVPRSALRVQLADEAGIAPATVISRSRFRIGVLVYAGPHPWRNAVVLPHWPLTRPDRFSKPSRRACSVDAPRNWSSLILLRHRLPVIVRVLCLEQKATKRTKMKPLTSTAPKKVQARSRCESCHLRFLRSLL